MRFKREGYRPDRDIILALTADEEGGTFNGVDWLLKQHRDLVDADFALNPDSGGVTTQHGKALAVEVASAEKLYADFELKATNPGGHSRCRWRTMPSTTWPMRWCAWSARCFRSSSTP